MSWRNLKLGQRITWIEDGFDCVKPKRAYATITEVAEDHVIATEDGNNLKLWIDDDTWDNKEEVVR